MFASVLFENEPQTDQILNLIEQTLREGDADLAAERLEFALEALDELGHPITGFCRAVPVEHIELLGWETLADQLASLDGAETRITAISIDLSCHGDPKPDAYGHFEPHLEINYYSDRPFPFSAANRAELLVGYGENSAVWQGGFEHINGAITTRGLDELNAAVVELEQVCRRGQTNDGADHDALLIGSAFMAVRLHQAVKAKIMLEGLPGPLTVLVGSNESFPLFDAPVITRDEYAKAFPQLEVVPPSSAHVPEDFPELQIDLNEPSSGSEIRRVLLRQQATAISEAAPVLDEKPIEKPAGLLKRFLARR